VATNATLAGLAVIWKRSDEGFVKDMLRLLLFIFRNPKHGGMEDDSAF